MRELSELRGCKVIEGSLSIVHIERSNESDFAEYEFPLLTEITEFLLVYRVMGLTSLGKLFPNLRIIRGNALVYNHAFLVYEMMHLKVKETISK